MPPRHRERRGRSLSSAEEEGGGTKTSATCSEKPGQERRAQMAAEMVGGPKEGGEGDAGRPDSEIFAKLDPRLLDCIICSEPLRPPIFQCEIGHVLCFVCRGKLRSNLCPTCFQAIGFNCCFAIEQMTDAVKVPCSNSYFGCDEYITYYQKEKHEKTCMHAPCFAQKMVAHLKDRRHRFSIILSPSTNGLPQTSIMTRRRGFPSHGTAGSCSWSGRTSPCS
ncbi:hypothetical protein BDA96_03G095000 [Sorghum bicolor]|uniref:RING-type E3 ubiquitin transferase n=2 Tax=Sorghum bicolor TaxID=4558 RepID=A0A1B6Q272_SORBI|nr:putative E3 ubiquitin-protein ligase SINA-like 9 [Sorghum bicolor]KAG0536811.1 hypothetical protein BDA96_03G095000 [Sorghum bicolor]KXG32014.1 hypothetical protein SORBI_3003G090600 [Sorghum bicolor]|eukprot:XP_021313546.1 putative E3 ubiquitin-protein ligase SINA-like 9 [Sorghum bicolor]